MSDPYSALGVAKGASEKEIKTAYRKLAKELHPDKNKDNPKATERFSNVTMAYDLLMDKDKRAQFDRGEIDGEGNPTSPFGAGFGGGGFGGQRNQQSDFGTDGLDLGDIFDGIFGGGGGNRGGGFGGQTRSAPPPKGANTPYNLNVEFVPAATLEAQRITLSDGKTISLKLPKGVETGTQMKLKGKGQVGPGGAGDAIITITVRPHPFYTRSGNNVELDLPISLPEAVKGAKVKVPTVDGPVMANIPKGANSGQVLRLKGKGFHMKNGKRGDQLVRLLIDLPKDDEALRDFADNWDSSYNPRAALGV